jgi:hypothetical protein
MTLLSVLLAALLLAAPAERPAAVVQAPDSPVRLDHALVLTPDQGPPVLLYSATNTTDAALDQFTVIAFVFDEKGTLKARQMAPARRELKASETKYSTLVLDGSPVTPTDIIVIGVNQAQRVGSESWWRGELQNLAEAAAHTPKPREE